MAGEWKYTTWGEEISLEYGKALRDYYTAGGKFRVYGSNGPIGWTSHALVQGPGVVLGRKGAYRGIQYSRDPFFVIDTAYYVKPKRADLDMRWLYYAMQYYKLGEIDDGSPIPSTTRSAVYVQDLRVPALPEQEAIAKILGSLDDKIELNRKVRETLEEMARAIFKSWFVDFDPVAAKSEGRQPEGMDAEIAKLFPDSFVDSAIGRIPTGWEVCGLDGTADYLNGLALQKYPADEAEDSLPAIKIAQLRVDHTLGADRVNTNVPKDYIIQDGDVLFSWSGSLTVVLWCGGCGALNQHLFKVSSKRFQKWFYYLWTLQHLPEFRCIAADKATTMGHIQRHHLSAAKVLVPKPELLAHMDRVFDPIIQNIIRLKIESHTLSSLRDTLLPRLLSGDFDGIPDSNNMEAL